MSKVIKFKAADFVNINGRPMNLTFKKIVQGRCPDLKCKHKKTMDETLRSVRE